MSSAPSDQASFRQTLNFGGVSFPDPIRCCQSHKLNTLFILSLSLSFLSLLVTRPLSNTYSNHSLFQVWVVVFFLLQLRFIHGAREPSSVVLEKLSCIRLYPEFDMMRTDSIPNEFI